MIILLVSDSFNYKYAAAFFFDFKQLPTAKTVEIPSGLLTESETGKFDVTLK